MTEPPFLAAPVDLLPSHRRHHNRSQRLGLPDLAPPPRPQTCRASSRQVGGGGKGRGRRRRTGAQGGPELGLPCHRPSPGAQAQRRRRDLGAGCEFQPLPCLLTFGPAGSSPGAELHRPSPQANRARRGDLLSASLSFVYIALPKLF